MASQLYKARAGDELAKLRDAVSEVEETNSEQSKKNKELMGIE